MMMSPSPNTALPHDDEPISTLHREKDNFYKYKTAEQVTKHLARFSLHQTHSSSFGGDTNNNNNNTNPHRNSDTGSSLYQQQQQQLDTMKSNRRGPADGAPSCPLVPLGVVSHTRKRYGSASSSKRSSFDTLSSGSGSQGRRSSPIAASGNAPVRRVSFKTHTHTYQHRYRARDKELSGGGASASATNAVAGGSKVAKLTQKFNEIIQKDDKLLAEVRRNRGVLMARGGHVYKVIAAPPPPQQHHHATPTKTAPPKPAEQSAGEVGECPLYSTVQKTIRKFEKVSKKPLVPEKSQLVLRMQRELSSTLTARRERTEQREDVACALAMVQEEAVTPLNQWPTADDDDDDAAATVRLGGTVNVPYAECAASTYTPVSPTSGDAAYQAETQIQQNEAKEEEEAALRSADGVVVVAAAATTNCTDNGKQPTARDSVAQKATTQAAETDHENNNNNNASTTPTKSKDRRSKYSLIYEKLRRRPAKTKAKVSTEDPQQAQSPTATPTSTSKLLDALNVVDQRLKVLTDSDTTAATAATMPAMQAVMVVHRNEDFEKRVMPNSSFVHQHSNSNTSGHSGGAACMLGPREFIAQAVNVTLVNSIEGEQMIMEQKELQAAKRCSTASNVTEVAEEAQEYQCHEDYEVIETMDCIPPTPTPTPTPQPAKTAKAIESFVYKQIVATTETEPPAPVAQHDLDNIYQTIVEAVAVTVAVATPSAPLDDYEPIADPASPHLYHDYEICELPAVMVRNTNDELPELPKPKRRLPKSPMPGKRTPPRPSVKALGEQTMAASSTALHRDDVDDDDDDDDEHHYYADDENIYDTIKIGGSHCYESLPITVNNNNNNNTTTTTIISTATTKTTNTTTTSNNYNNNDTLPKAKKLSTRNSDCSSIASNCYESITQYRRHHTHNRLYQSTAATVHAASSSTATTGSSSGSTLTISSDHKTNSLYEDSLIAATGNTALMELHHHQQLHHHHSHHQHQTLLQQLQLQQQQQQQKKNQTISTSTSENSDGWIDISDTEGNAMAQPQFIVVRERSKVHRSPDWSKRVREGRLRKNKSGSDDDSDHLYETLPVAAANRRQSNRVVRRASSNRKRCTNELWRPNGFPAFPEDLHCPNPALPAVGGNGLCNDSDSFATDTDEGEHEQSTSLCADSGVDLRRLPPPPPTSNSMYSLVRKMKKFITPGSKNKPPKNPKKSVGSLPDNLYENTEFLKQTEPPPATPPSAVPVTSNANGSGEKAAAAVYAAGVGSSDNALATAKSKAGRSFKSRLRKSLVGSPFDSKCPGGGNALAPARSTFYINEPSHYGDSTGDFDSGLSEKASSGDLPPPPPLAPAQFSQQQQQGKGKGEKTPSPSQSTPPSKSAVESTKFLTVMRKSKKESSSSANQQRRRTLMGIRPDVPPPPPPEDAVYKKGSHRREAVSTTSWYAECGVFELASGELHADDQTLKVITAQNGCGVGGVGGPAISPSSRNTSWYAESGLYQTSAGSVASSSGSSGVSTGNEGGPGDDLPHGMFSNEPLYQMYTAAKVEQSISRDMDEVSTDGYEDIEQTPGVTQKATAGDDVVHQKRTRPTALQLVEPKNGPSRTLWSELPEVINSGILPKLPQRERALQEAKFEIITSEASYLKSLNLLRSHYMRHPIFADPQMVSTRDKQALFANILPVIECSERLLMQLEQCWQDDVRLMGMSERIFRIAEQQFNVYVAFCEQQGHMDRTLRALKEQKGQFAQHLELLEASAVCCGLNLHSFLMLPMQRITRLPLLIDAVFSKTSPHDPDYDSWKMTLAIMNKIVTQCNEAANRFEQAYEIDRISRQLEFPAHIRPLAIAPAGVAEIGTKPRFLVKKGELTHLIWRGDDAKLTFGKKFTKAPIYAFLFSDLLVLTKQRAPQQQYTVFDYCTRNFLTISTGEAVTQLPTKDINSTAAKNLILMTLLENHEKKTVELVLSCPSVSEQQRWLQAMRPPEAENPGEKLYEQWDCPQVIAKHEYEAHEPDALNLEISDVVNVSRKLPDGWFYGERIRDGAMGWFPGNYTEEVNSAHVRARNLKQRYRLLTFTASYIEMQKRK